MNLKVIVKCLDCDVFNFRRFKDTPSDEDLPDKKQCKFESFDEACKHNVENPEHDMVFMIIDDDNQEEDD